MPQKKALKETIEWFLDEVVGPEPPANHWVVNSESAITGSFGNKECVWRANVAPIASDDSGGRTCLAGAILSPSRTSCTAFSAA